MADPVPLRPDASVDAPGMEFNSARYSRELAYCGLARSMGGSYGTLVALSWHANEQAQAWPTVATLAQEVGCSPEQIRLDLRKLVQWGALAIAHHRTIDAQGRRRGGRAHHYIVLPLSNIRVNAVRHGFRAPVGPRCAQPRKKREQRASAGAQEEQTQTPLGEQTQRCLGEQTQTPLGLYKGRTYQDERTKMNVPSGSGAQAPAPPSPAASCASSALSEESTPTRKKALRYAEPDVWRRREAIKRRWHDLSGVCWDRMERARQKWLDTDAERLARDCQSTEEALAIMQAVYDVTWRDGTKRYRPFKLRDVVENVKPYRDGELDSGQAQTPEEDTQLLRFLDLFGQCLRPVGVTDEPCFRRQALRAIRAYGLAPLCGCLRAMATSKGFQGRSFVTPDVVAGNVFTWQDAGEPRSWKRVEEWLDRKAQREGAAR